MHQLSTPAVRPVRLPTRTVPRDQFDRTAAQRDMYQRFYFDDRAALAAERQESHRLRMLVVSLGGDPGRRP